MKIIHVDYRHHDCYCFRKSAALVTLEEFERMTGGAYNYRIRFTPNWNCILYTRVAQGSFTWKFPSRSTLVAEGSRYCNKRKDLWPMDELGKPVDYCVLATSARFTDNY